MSNKPRADGHHCHAIQCDVPVPPRMWGCLRHWKMVPKFIRDKIWEHYVTGQEEKKNPTRVYMYWFYRACIAVADKEGLTSHPDYLYAEKFIAAHKSTTDEDE